MRLPKDKFPDRAILLDQGTIRELYDQRAAAASWPLDEVWDGVLVLLPHIDNDHQRIKVALCAAVSEVVEGTIRYGANVSDRSDWMTNFRCPDVVAYLPGNPAVSHDTHWVGGPDFLVEVLCPGERRDDKLGFYASVNTREVLIVNRKPWSLELYRLRGKKLVLADCSVLPKSAVLKSQVLPLTFQLRRGKKRPRIEVVHPSTGTRWEA